ncbi:hypothetical protein DPMN_192616 [Dreissena polymorpha]|uniref:Uncharacterized protein n=1 Tax=Dreissena polymorpha TaxID=45954 RepID=A0A9D4BFU6_DREPO|nr:hypothetical protein DPMN_192616 [Dreissena polymorpha]
MIIRKRRFDKRIISGRKAEGQTGFCESDHDWLYMLNRVLCVEGGISLHTIPDDIEVYMMDKRVYHGQCRMLLKITTSTPFSVHRFAMQQLMS